MSNKLKKLDFSSGIRANDIQHNFDTMDGQLQRERARIGGFGIVEGFKIEVISSNHIRIGEGVIINKAGEEIIIPERTAHLSSPYFAEHKLNTQDDALTVNDAGEITLPNYPYSDKKKGFIENNYYQTNYPSIQDELLISDALNPDLAIRALRVEGRLVTLDANIWGDRKVFVEYLHTKNRMDTILVNAEGDLKIEEGVLTSSPSHVNLDRYDGYFVLAIVEVLVDKDVTLRTHEELKTFRKVYVDKDNRLYVNGKLYQESQIVHFTEPEEPYINALWYDSASNKLMIWKDYDGTIGWVGVNEEKHIPVKQVKIFSPEAFPGDGQTFLFDKEEIQYHFIPGHNQLEIIVDNAPVMSDQFEEIIDPDIREFTNSGIGFKLKDPLDKATYVEVRVLHTVNSFPIRKTFQRTATFVNDSFAFHNNLNKEKHFETEVPYVIGERQLEVFVDGVKMERTLEFEEMSVDGPTENGASSTVFRILKDIKPGQRVSYRISKNLYSYDHLDGWVDEIEEKADKALSDIKDTNSNIATLDRNVQSKLKTVDENIVKAFQEISKQSEFVKKTDKLKESNMPDSIKNNIPNGGFNTIVPAGSITTLQGMKASDFIIIHYVSGNQNRVLLKEIDYVIQQQGANLLVVLGSELVDSSSSLYISGIKFGV